MWRSATSSESAPRYRVPARFDGNRRAARALRWLPVAAALWCSASGLSARVLLSLEEALSLAFPGAVVGRATEYLSTAQLDAVTAACGQAPASALVVRYLATRDGRRIGTAYVDTHRVRTLPETVLIVVAPDGTAARVEVLSFAEPDEYMPREVWYRLFEGRALDDELALKRGIRPVTGATLTASATTAAVRRVLALHRVIEGSGAP